MFQLRETNPHFQSRQPPNPQIQPPRPRDGRDRRTRTPTLSSRPQSQPPYPRTQQPLPQDVSDHHRTPTWPPPQSQPLLYPPQTQPQDGSDHHIPTRPDHPMVMLPPQPQPVLYPQTHPQDGSDHHMPARPDHPMVVLPPRPKQDNRPQSPPPRAPRHPRSRPPPEHTDPEDFHPSSLRVPAPRKTKRITWLAAIFCVVFWVVVIIGGLILLVIYLAYRPRLPKFDVASATLNAAYLDMGYLLNSDMNILANFTNPNKKVNVDFNDIVISLYFEGARIATRYVEPLSVRNKDYKLANVHMVTSQVAFSNRLSQHLAKQIAEGRVFFEIKSFLRTKSSLGSFLKYSYWLYGHCKFVVSAPPDGVLLAKKCVTKR